MDRLISIPDRDSVKSMREHQNPHQKDEVSIPARDFKAQEQCLGSQTRILQQLLLGIHEAFILGHISRFIPYWQRCF
jgi:hypothetical protein